MTSPDNKGNLETSLSKPVQLPKADSSLLINSDVAPSLPARPNTSISSSTQPTEAKQADTKLVVASEAIVSKPNLNNRPVLASNSEDTAIQSRQTNIDKLQQKQDAEIRAKLIQHRIEDIGLLVARAEQERKALLDVLFKGQVPDIEIGRIAEAVIQLAGNSSVSENISGGEISQEALAKHLLNYIQQQKSFDCTVQELAMLDSLEFHLMRMLSQINPAIRQQQQQQAQDDGAPDDESSSSGPEKEEGESESPFEASEDFDTDSEYAPSPRSKKGKARARSRRRDRKNRFKKWLERMMRAFGRQSLFIRGPMRAQTVLGKTKQKEDSFVKTVRVYGRVVDARTRRGIEGVQIVSSNIGTSFTDSDGMFAFENVVIGTNYSLAPIRSGFTFSPLSVNDIALDYREYIFAMTKN